MDEDGTGNTCRRARIGIKNEVRQAYVAMPGNKKREREREEERKNRNLVDKSGRRVVKIYRKVFTMYDTSNYGISLRATFSTFYKRKTFFFLPLLFITYYYYYYYYRVSEI